MEFAASKCSRFDEWGCTWTGGGGMQREGAASLGAARTRSNPPNAEKEKNPMEIGHTTKQSEERGAPPSGGPVVWWRAGRAPLSRWPTSLTLPRGIRGPRRGGRCPHRPCARSGRRAPSRCGRCDGPRGDDAGMIPKTPNGGAGEERRLVVIRETRRRKRERARESARERESERAPERDAHPHDKAECHPRRTPVANARIASRWRAAVAAAARAARDGDAPLPPPTPSS